ncbi:MAG TPA: RES family NAD+ phosphorylase [Alphaproteobacteria bacterium]
MSADRRPRDLALLDALDAKPRETFDGVVWRALREGRDPLQGHPSAGRWDPGTFDVIYASLDRDGAHAELHFHLTRQPVFPSRMRFLLHRIRVRTRQSLRLPDMNSLDELGVEAAHYRDLLYSRTQEIGDAAAFLGFDSLIVPSARWQCLNIVLFTDRFAPADLTVETEEPVDWDAWRKAQPRRL